MLQQRHSEVAKDLLVSSLFRTPEAEERVLDLAKADSIPVRQADFAAPYIFLDRFTKSKAGNRAIAEGAADRLSKLFGLESPERVLVLEIPRDHSAVLSSIRADDKDFIERTDVRCAVLGFHLARGFTSVRELLQLRSYLKSHGITLYAIVDDVLEQVTERNALPLCSVARTDLVAASGRGCKRADASKRKRIDMEDSDLEIEGPRKKSASERCDGEVELAKPLRRSQRVRSKK